MPEAKHGCGSLGRSGIGVSSERPLLRTPLSQRSPMREIADAPSLSSGQPEGASLRFARPCPERCHRAGQLPRPDTTVRVQQLRECQTLPISLAPDLLPLEQLLHPKPQGILPQSLQRRRLIGDHRPRFLHPFWSS